MVGRAGHTRLGTSLRLRVPKEIRLRSPPVEVAVLTRTFRIVPKCSGKQRALRARVYNSTHADAPRGPLSVDPSTELVTQLVTQDISTVRVRGGDLRVSPGRSGYFGWLKFSESV
jgi:hypothetical protein